MSLFLVISANAAQVLISEIAKIYFELSSSSAPPGTGIEPIVPAHCARMLSTWPLEDLENVDYFIM